MNPVVLGATRMNRSHNRLQSVVLSVHSMFTTITIAHVIAHVTNLKVAGSRPDEVNDFYQIT
jgi:hypothetical protein